MYVKQAGWHARTHANTHAIMAVNQQKVLGAGQSDEQCTRVLYSLSVTVGTTGFTESLMDWNIIRAWSGLQSGTAGVNSKQ